jgi:hypothetical protein
MSAASKVKPPATVGCMIASMTFCFSILPSQRKSGSRTIHTSGSSVFSSIR